MKVHHIPARNGKCFQSGWLCFTGTWSQVKGPRPQLLPPWYLGRLGLPRCLEMKERNWVATCFGLSTLLLGNLIFELSMCLYFAAWEKIGWGAKAWLEDELKYLPVLKKNKQKTNPTHKSSHCGGADRGFKRSNSLGCFLLTLAFKHKPAACCCTEASPLALSRHVKSFG